eukprot:GHVT01087497.1.p1 GENE.GHVT01087497.1~~GHVT01087497.1.p1  ORF type:complete len:226 (+),score=19.39 GHVT01087497.1:211-888(+)
MMIRSFCIGMLVLGSFAISEVAADNSIIIDANWTAAAGTLYLKAGEKVTATAALTANSWDCNTLSETTTYKNITSLENVEVTKQCKPQVYGTGKPNKLTITPVKLETTAVFEQSEPLLCTSDWITNWQAAREQLVAVSVVGDDSKPIAPATVATNYDTAYTAVHDQKTYAVLYEEVTTTAEQTPTKIYCGPLPDNFASSAHSQYGVAATAVATIAAVAGLVVAGL